MQRIFGGRARNVDLMRGLLRQMAAHSERHVLT